MLGVRLSVDEEARLARHARELGRPKSVLVRDWIMERLDRDEVDALIRRAAQLHAENWTEADREAANASSDAFSRWLDAEDGGYDWGPEGPPQPR